MESPPFDTAIHVKTPEPDESIFASIHLLRQELSKEDLYGIYNSWCSDEMCHRFLIARQFNVKASSDL